VGSGADGSKAALERLRAGADGVLFHGSPPAELAGVLREWANIRPAVTAPAASRHGCKRHYR
jgi:hypothetical protein